VHSVSQISPSPHLPEVTRRKSRFFAQGGFARDGNRAGGAPVDKSVEKKPAESAIY